MHHDQTRKPHQRGFTLLEMLVVLVVIGILAAIILPKMRGFTYDATAKQADDFFHAAATNWKLLNQRCGTAGDVASSAIVATPSATNSLALVVNGDAYLNASYTGCYNSTGVVPLIGKVTGNPTDGYTLAGYPISWTGGGSSSPISYTVTGIPVETVLILYNQFSSAAGAKNATALNSAGDNTDPKIRYTAPASGTTTLTFRVY